MASSETDNNHNDKDNISPPDQSASDPIPTGPLRILVQTKTHLVPGDVYSEKIQLMRNLICQHVWGRDFIPSADRWDGYALEFGHDNRTCFFLVDSGMTAEHGETPTDEPQVIWLRWTGDTFVRLPGEIPSKLRARLKKHPFTKEPTQQPPRTRQPIPMRERIRSSLHLKEDIFYVYLEHLADHPEDVRWLKDNLEPKFWSRLEAEGVKLPDEGEQSHG